MKSPLQNGLAQLGLTLTEDQQQKLLDYVALLHKWNKTYNLTAIRNPSEMLSLHILDSLSIAAYLTLGMQHIDVGTGGGLPGIPLSIVFPEQHFTLLDSNGKKTRFLTHVQNHLSLKNVTVVNHRVEAYQPPALFDTIISRAFSSLEDMIQGTRHLLKPTGRWLAMKGQLPDLEIKTLTPLGLTPCAHALTVPGVSANRYLIEIKNTCIS